jgi:hypothetical protein
MNTKLVKIAEIIVEVDGDNLIRYWFNYFGIHPGQGCPDTGWGGMSVGNLNSTMEYLKLKLEESKDVQLEYISKYAKKAGDKP